MIAVAKLTPRALLLVALFACVAYASIEREPVRVTHRNSGPRYDIDDVERTRLGADNPESNQVPTGPARHEQQDGNENQDENRMVSIRRIFVVPMMTSSSSSSGDDNDRPQMSDPMGMFGGPARPSFWPFQTLHPSRHLFGADDASRPSAARPVESDDREKQEAAASGERDAPNSNERPVKPLLDPIEMLMEAMRQALNPDNMLAWHPKAPSAETDLNKEASGDNKPMGDSALERPSKPQTFNETKEDIVEIEGKKYIRKTVVNRHVGDGIMFMTRRLIFSPLNETDSEAPSTTTTSTQTPVPENKEVTSTTTIAPPAEEWPVFRKTSSVKPAASEPPSTTVEPVATEVPSKPTSDAEPNSPTTTVASKVEETTKAESAADRVSEILHKVERLMKKDETERKEASTTVKPNEAS